MRRRLSWLTVSNGLKLLTMVALVLMFASYSPAQVRAFNIYGPNPGGAGDYVRNLSPDQPAPFAHWDLREFSGSEIPWSATNRHPDLDGDGLTGAADPDERLLVFNAINDAFQSWEDVQPAALGFVAGNRWGAVPAGVRGIALDDYNLVDWAEAARDDTQTVLPGDPVAVAGIVVTAGPNGFLETQPRGDDYIDYTAAPNVVRSGADGVAGTAANNQGSIGGALALTGLFFNNQTGVIREADIVFRTAAPTTWVIGPNNSAANQFDIQGVATHEIGHFAGIAHSGIAHSGPPPPADGVTPTMTQGISPDFNGNTNKRTLENDDRNAANFMYTPEHGDAPESYVTKVKTTNAGPRVLSGVPVMLRAEGPEHIFGYQPTGDVYEWLGSLVDNSADAEEGEAKLVNQDEHDDGVIFGPWRPGAKSWVEVRVNIRNAGAHAGDRYLNGWIDFNGDGDWDEANEKVIGNAGAVVFNTVGEERRRFDIDIPLAAVEETTTWARFRLDFGENVGALGNIDGSLAQYGGAAQSGEVEDYPIAVLGHGWWEETETPGWWQPPMPSPDTPWRSRPENSSYRSPHGGYVTTSNLCKLCHAVHNGVLTGYRLLRDPSRSTECVYCHWSTSAVSSYKMYTVTNPKGEHSIGATMIPDSSVNGGTGDNGNLPDRNPVAVGGGGAELDCYQCHSVHGANTIGADPDHDGDLDPIAMDGVIYDSSDTVENWNYKILRVDPSGDGSVLAKGEGGLTAGEWATELATRPEAVRTAFCADCHNLNPNWARTAADEDRPNKRSHVQGPGADGQLEVYGEVSQVVAWDTSEEQGCRGCHAATDEENSPGDSQFPHQSVGNKLLDDSYDTTPTDDPVGDPQRALPNMDVVCLGCHRNALGTQGAGIDY